MAIDRANHWGSKAPQKYSLFNVTKPMPTLRNDVRVQTWERMEDKLCESVEWI